MRCVFRICLIAFLSTAALPAHGQGVLPSFGDDRAGTAGFQFLKVPSDARSAALSTSAVTSVFDASALFWNPALAAKTNTHQIGLHHTRYYDGVSLNYGGGFYHWRPAGLTVGAYIQALDSGEMTETTEFQPFGTGRTFSWMGLSAGLSVSQSLTDLFSYGLTVKGVRLGTLELSTTTAMADLGFHYQIGETGVAMAVAIRNFGLDAAFEGELDRPAPPSDGGTITETDFAGITPPTSFLLGVSYHLFRSAQNDLVVSGQLQNPNDNAERFSVSAEYTWNQLAVLRAGYRFAPSAPTWPSVGLGLHVPGLPTRFDYSFNRHDYLGSVHRVGLNLHL